MKDIKLFIYDKTRSNITRIFTGLDYDDCSEEIIPEDEENFILKEQIYHEMTIQYWAWKNVKAEYVGFGRSKQRIDYSDKYNSLNEAMNNADIILSCGEVYSTWLKNLETTHFKGLDKRYTANVEDVYSTLLRLFPDYAATVKRFKEEGLIFDNSNFFMKREFFCEYCEMLFAVLFDIEEKTDFAHYNEQEMHIFSFMAQIILGLYILKLTSEQHVVRVLGLPVKTIHEEILLTHVYPAYSEKNVAIALACNEQYMPILGVMLKSLLDHVGAEHNYDIMVMQRDINAENISANRNKSLIKSMVDGYTNVSIRFIDVSALIDAERFYVHYNYTPETYFRLFLPQILSGYSKILYMDADIIIRKDVAELYNTELEGAIIGAVRDPIINGTAKSTRWNMQYNMSELGIDNIYNYFQAGVLLIDIDEISKNGLSQNMIEYAMTHECELVDQDVLNLFCQGRVKFIDNKWNVDMNPVAMEVVPAAPAEVWNEYRNNREEAYIYHFAGEEKPWLIPDLYKADVFWEVARKTPWYEQLLANMMKRLSSAQKKNSVFEWRFPYELISPGSSIGIYGAGNVGRSFKKNMSATNYATVLLWVDKDYANLAELGVKSPEVLKENKDIDKIVIAINNIGTAKEVRLYLQDLGIEPDRIVWKDYSR